jgi:hypothetical protein
MLPHNFRIVLEEHLSNSVKTSRWGRGTCHDKNTCYHSLVPDCSDRSHIGRSRVRYALYEHVSANREFKSLSRSALQAINAQSANSTCSDRRMAEKNPCRRTRAKPEKASFSNYGLIDSRVDLNPTFISSLPTEFGKIFPAHRLPGEKSSYSSH